ncbi:hypothetical protein AB0F72_31475 [Actinoplanes sp. NPDC023936]|uniref:DUF7779 domain-containing protein n=1 Tax=Actinoplanes sp. NPDC023936 TaxID=3154910 RepID=UPI0034099A72
MTRPFGRASWRSRRGVLLLVAAILATTTVAVALVMTGRLVRLDWAATERAGWVAGIIGALLSFLSTAAAFLALRSHRQAGAPPGRRVADRLVHIGPIPQAPAWSQPRRTQIELAKAATSGRTTVLTQVLSGMGGVGKTQRLNDRKRPLRDVLPAEDALPDAHSVTVAATWALSIDAADRLPPRGVARSLIAVAALLDPNGIPAGLFTAEAMIRYVRRSTGRDMDGETITDGLRNLHRLSLVTHDPNARHVRVHALVQRTTREASGRDPILRAVAHACRGSPARTASGCAHHRRRARRAPGRGR